MLEIKPAQKYITRGGKYVDIHSQKTMQQGRVKFWHGFVLSHMTHRGGTQNAWNESGEDMGGNSDLDLVAPAYTEEASRSM